MNPASPARWFRRLGPVVVPRRAQRLARVVVLAVVIGIGISDLYWAVTQWHMADAGAYWGAAERLRHGEALYPPVTDPESSNVYRYAPWFAWLAVPFTFLPQPIAGVIWSGILVGASCLAVLPLARRRAWLQVAFFWPILIGISANGNVHALVVAILVLGVERRTGPLWIAVAASVKAFPILYVLVYVARREWLRALVACVVTAVLVAPMLLYDLSNYVTSPGFAGLLINWPALYIVAIAALAGVTLYLGQTRWGWLAASLTVAMALPRFFLYDVTYLQVAVPWRAPADEPARREMALSARPTAAGHAR